MSDTVTVAADSRVQLNEAQARVYANMNVRKVGISVDGASTYYAIGLLDAAQARKFAAAIVAAADACEPELAEVDPGDGAVAALDAALAEFDPAEAAMHRRLGGAA